MSMQNSVHTKNRSANDFIIRSAQVPTQTVAVTPSDSQQNREQTRTNTRSAQFSLAGEIVEDEYENGQRLDTAGSALETLNTKRQKRRLQLQRRDLSKVTAQSMQGLPKFIFSSPTSGAKSNNSRYTTQQSIIQQSSHLRVATMPSVAGLSWQGNTSQSHIESLAGISPRASAQFQTWQMQQNQQDLSMATRRSLYSSKYSSKGKLQTEGAETPPHLEYAEQLAMQRTMLQSRNARVYDQEAPDMQDSASVATFYGHFKRLEYIKQQNIYLQVHSSPYTTILQKCQKRGIVPSKLGLIQAERKDTLQIKNMRFGDNYMRVLGRGLQDNTTLKNFELGSNRLTEASAAKLLRKIAPRAQHLDLSNNRIGLRGIESVAAVLETRESRLSLLRLQDNALCTPGVKRLLQSACTGSSLRILDLSRNSLQDGIAEDVARLLREGSLTELYLHWNQLRARFGAIIFTALRTCDTLKVLDLSHNKLGRQSDVAPTPPKKGVGAATTSTASGNNNNNNNNTNNARVGENVSTCAEEICVFFRENKDIVHLDLSLNQFDAEECALLSEAVCENHTIYGLHFAGNHAYVDARGFIVTEQQQDDVAELTVKKRIDGVRMVSRRQRTLRDVQLRDCCWICEGWREVEFQYNPLLSERLGTQLDSSYEEERNSQSVRLTARAPYDTEHLFLNLNFENYRSVYLGGAGTKKVIRMVPAGATTYFFSNSFEECFATQGHEILRNEIVLEDVQLCEKVVKRLRLETINRIISGRRETPLLLPADYTPQCVTLPRTRESIYIPAKQKRRRVRWTYPKSIFTRWVPDDAELINMCFEYDWDCSKVPKIVKTDDELRAVKEFFRIRYKFVKDTYKHYSSFNPVGDVWAIQQLAFSELIESCRIIDGIKVTQADINIKWTAVVSGIKGLTPVPATQLFSADSERRKSVLSMGVISSMSIIDDPTDRTPLASTTRATEKSNYKYDVEKVPRPYGLRYAGGSEFSGDLVFDEKRTLTHLRALPQQNIDLQTLQGGKNPRNPERGLNRHQLMELLVRIAEEKYINKFAVTKLHSQALRLLWQDHLQAEFTSHDWHTWRETRFWCEEVDMCLKAYRRIVENVYRKFAVKKVRPGQQPFMCLDELNQITVQCELTNEGHFGQQVYLMAYNLSMMTQIDELCSDRIFQMQLPEFYEALARIAEEASLIPAPGLYPEDTTWLLELRRTLPLSYKLESLIRRIFKACCDGSFRETFAMPEMSIFYKDPNESEVEIVDE